VNYGVIVSESEEPSAEQQPVERRRFDVRHYVRPADAPTASSSDPKRSLIRRLGHRLAHLLDDRKPSDYSSISPRLPDGSHTKIFPFNGNGKSS
jgi:hypothetical protein